MKSRILLALALCASLLAQSDSIQPSETTTMMSLAFQFTAKNERSSADALVWVNPDGTPANSAYWYHKGRADAFKEASNAVRQLAERVEDGEIQSCLIHCPHPQGAHKTR